MEDKQLNIQQPIPSVRRFLYFKKPPLPPSRNSGFKSGPITNPGTVPFIWEQSPGQPKGQNPPENYDIQRLEMVPMGKISKAKKQESDKSFTKFVKESDPGDGNGMTGRDLKQPGIHSTDQLTQDHMMGRVFPEAKAVAQETPQYCDWNQLKEKENDNKQSPVRGGAHVVLGLENDNKKCQFQDRTHIVPDFRREIDEQESDDEYDEYPKSPLKICGILPRFCFLNPIPGRNRLPMSPVHRIHRSPNLKPKESLGIHGEANDDSGRAIFEKTLYVDTIHKVESPKWKPSLRKNDFKILSRSERIKETHLIDSRKDTRSSNIAEDVIAKQHNDNKQNQEMWVHDEASQDLIDLQNKREDRFISFEFPVPPPLPKNPKDSWLNRTLPPKSSNNLSVRSKSTAGDPELKMNAKITEVQNSNSRLLEEPLAPIPEND